MGVRVSSAWLLRCVIITFAAARVAAADAACSKGDTPCFCKSIGGTWKAMQTPLLPSCKVTYQHQGMNSMCRCEVCGHQEASLFTMSVVRNCRALRVMSTWLLACEECPSDKIRNVTISMVILATCQHTAPAVAPAAALAPQQHVTMAPAAASQRS